MAGPDVPSPQDDDPADPDVESVRVQPMNAWTARPARTVALILGAIAAVTMFALYNPWVTPKDNLLNLTTWVFWISALGLLVALYLDRKNEPESDTVEIEGPAFARFLFNNSRAGLFWLPIRLFVGFEWFEAGWHKFTGTGWLDGGGALLGYWNNAVKIPEQGAPSITFEWYRDFLQLLIDNHANGWFAFLIVFGEMAVGLAILFGALTGVAAFFGALMNMSFLLAGSASVNPVLFTFAIGLMLAWKVAGFYGLDRYLLPALGAPWRPGSLFAHGRKPAVTSHSGA
jgi:thiosulfate dehydrogenase [quinone] large subunit